MHFYLIWLSYFYLAMSMRENVLMVNGSHIKNWWIQHHYWSAACSMLLLALPVYSPGGWQYRCTAQVRGTTGVSPGAWHCGWCML